MDSLPWAGLFGLPLPKISYLGVIASPGVALDLGINDMSISKKNVY